MLAKATFAAGCFWGVEAKFRSLPGVIETQVGYTGGHLKNATYKQVCSGATGHAEALEVAFDPNLISYEQLLEFFFHIHDPTSLNCQGPDVGEQYRSAIFTHTPEQLQAALKAKAALEKSGKKIATQILPAGPFYRAEEYHQRYHEKHGGSCNL